MPERRPFLSIAARGSPDRRVSRLLCRPQHHSPEILPIKGLTFTEHRCKKFDGTTELAAIVDAAGQPRQITFLHPLGSELDKIALQIVSADRFKPGAHDGVPAAVGISLEGACKPALNTAGTKQAQKSIPRA